MRDETRFQLEQMLFRMFDRIEVEELAAGLADRRALDLVGMHITIRNARERYRDQGIPLDERARIAIVSEAAMELLGACEGDEQRHNLKDYVPKPPNGAPKEGGAPPKSDEPASLWRKIVVSGAIFTFLFFIVTGGVIYYRIQYDGVPVECAARDLVSRHITAIHTCADAQDAAGEAFPPVRIRKPR